ncbi:hypothetical protein Acsp05_17530 [Actinokineospora sp. NBRC 105648]|nr:hypothetical protein Acsp05_17530 [Actinokineospora sp. NBRC 105648]
MSVPLEQTIDRAQHRNTTLTGSAANTPDIERSWRDRYIPSQYLYLAKDRPTDRADIIVHNDQPQRPTWAVRPHSVPRL